MIRLKRDTYYATGYSAWFVLHIGWWCWFFGSGLKGRGPRLELFTPFHWFRWSRGYRQ